MEGSAADLLDSHYADIKSGGGFSSSNTKSRYKSRYMLTRSQSVLNAPDSAYAAVPMQFNRNTSNFIEHSEKYKQMPTDAERYDNRASMMGDEDVDKVAFLVNTQLHRRAVVLPYANNYFDNQSVEFIDKNTGDGCFFIPELEGGKDVTKAGVDKEEEKLHSKTNTPAPLVDNDYFNKEYKRTVLRYWTAPNNEQDVLEYLNIGDARQKRGCLYVNSFELFTSSGTNTCPPKGS
jgi:hypothetical protein